jgi:surface protein
MKLDNTTIREAVQLWIKDKNICIQSFGHISNWDTSEVTDMSSLFFQKRSFNDDIGFWNVSKVNNMSRMFGIAESFNQDICSWDVSNVVNMSDMFWQATSFNQPIGDWNVSKVTNMSRMFCGANTFNQPIGSWNVSKVTNMSIMFSGAKSFNQPIGDWDVSNVTNMELMFSGGSFFAPSSSFNQPIGSWNVSNVTNMSNMFSGATSFNQPIGSWNIDKVTNMSDMLYGASSFNPKNKPYQSISPNYHDNINDLKDILFHLELDGTFYYLDEDKKGDYFIAYQLIVIASDQDEEDCEFILLDYIKTALSDENLIFTDVGENSDTHRIIGLPKIEHFEFENGNFTLLDDTNIVDAIEFLRNIKTIHFNGLNSSKPHDIKNFKWVTPTK